MVVGLCAQLPSGLMLGATQAVDSCTAALERLDFSAAGRQTYGFFWNQFADWYVEAAKTRLYSSNPEAAAAARQVPSLCTTLMSPFELSQAPAQFDRIDRSMVDLSWN